MNKLPVFRTFGNAVGFAFGNFFTIFRLSWLPFAALLAVTTSLQFLMLKLIFEGGVNEAALERDPFLAFKKLDVIVLVQLAAMLLEGIVIAAVAVAIHRVILFADRKPGDYFSFAFGKTEFVYFLMAFLWSLIIFSILAVAVGPVIYLVAGGDFQGFFAKFKDWPKNAPSLLQSAAFGAIGIAYFVGWIIAIYVCLRFAVWPPSVVATGRLSPAEPWALTRGNVWRLIGLFVLTFFIIYLLIALPVAAFFYQMRMKGHLSPQPDATVDTQASQEAMQQMMDQQVAAYAPYAPLLLFVELLLYVFFTGLIVALVSYSYKALKGYDAHAPIPETA